LFIAFFCLNAPLLRNAQKRGGEKKKNGGNKSRIFCDEPNGFFNKNFNRVFELPLSRNAQKHD
jgi:hypothetical protein